MCFGGGEPPIPWHPGEGPELNKHTAYFGGALRAMERGLHRGGRTVYLTWDLDSLPTTGPDVVAVVLGDEWARVPRYARDVGAVFKCYGTDLEAGPSFWRRPSYLGALTAIQQARARLGRWRTAPETVFPIPLGYANQVELPLTPFAERRFDVSFAGSVVHRQRPLWSAKRWLQTPKSLARGALVSTLQRVQASRPEWSVGLTLTSGYAAIRTADADAYSRRMMDTRIALCPRGTSFETFRTFEALRAGCVVVGEALPNRWFYDGAPLVQIDDWRDLDSLLASLLRDPEALEQRHRASLAWWRDVCSEDALGAYLSERLNALDLTTR